MRKLAFVLILAFIASTAFTQKVKLTGTWKLNEKESMLFDQFTLAPSTMMITQKKKTFEVEKTNNFEGQEVVSKDLYTLDGEACENPGWLEGVKTSNATWDKKAGILNVTSKMEVQGMNVQIDEVYSMDGDKLVMKSVAITDMGDLEEKFVFDKE